MSNTQMGLIIFLVVVAAIAFVLSRRTRQQSEKTQRGLGVWAERVVAADVGAPVLREAVRHNRDIRTLPEMLVSERHGLAGKPDYAVVDGKFYLPVEKKKRRSEWLRPSDQAQVWAYCLLLEENGYPTRGGEVRYANRSFEVPFGPAARSMVIGFLEEMRRWQQVPARQVPKREGPHCRNCKWRRNCAAE